VVALTVVVGAVEHVVAQTTGTAIGTRVR